MSINSLKLKLEQNFRINYPHHWAFGYHVILIGTIYAAMILFFGLFTIPILLEFFDLSERFSNLIINIFCLTILMMVLANCLKWRNKSKLPITCSIQKNLVLMVVAVLSGVPILFLCNTVRNILVHGQASVPGVLDSIDLFFELSACFFTFYYILFAQMSQMTFMSLYNLITSYTSVLNKILIFTFLPTFSPLIYVLGIFLPFRFIINNALYFKCSVCLTHFYFLYFIFFFATFVFADGEITDNFNWLTSISVIISLIFLCITATLWSTKLQNASMYPQN